ncbi:MAG: glycosyltransferase family 2 protein [Pseudomonadota bacterium]|nr:glycosyltransferase family 2 protein [Pseudomonadota bacterium]
MQLCIVVPCYNEEEVLEETCGRLLALLTTMTDARQVSPASRICFVDDGSTDRTWALIESLAGKDGRVTGIKLSRNRGHQNALLAGLLTAEGDAIISVDADLQDDIDAIPRMIEQLTRGADIVFGVRTRRDNDAIFKRVTAHAFYRLMNRLGAQTIYDHADFRLMSRRAVEALRQYREVNVFLRGIVPLVGFPTAVVEYERSQRLAGTSKYPLRKMISFALEGVTSFSVVPLRIITFMGTLVFLITFGLGVWVLYVRLFTDLAVPGWASTMLPMFFLGGVQILCLGVMGEYLGRLYQEMKARPRYIIEKKI